MATARELVFNELSLDSHADNHETARVQMKEFLDLFKSACTCGFSRTLRSTREIFQKELTRLYTLNDWLVDNKISRDERNFILTALTKVSYIEDIQEQWLRDYALTSEFIYKERAARGLGFAFIVDGMALSICSDDEWNTNSLSVVHREMDEEAGIIEHQESVIHASQQQHISENNACLARRAYESIHSGDELWEKREELFPSLDFCPSVKRQVLSLHYPEVNQVKRKLHELEQRAPDGHFDSSRFSSRVTPESETRRALYQDELTITCPDSQRRLFNWHMRATPGSQRIYFEYLQGENRFIIGYIGLKIGR